MHRLKSWCLFSGCGLHDLTNAADWAMAPFMPTGMMDDLFICIESLRNGFRLLQSHILSWLNVSIQFYTVPPEDTRTLSLLYQALDLPSNLVEDLAERGVIYHNGMLFVSDLFQHDPSIYDFLYSSILSVWRFRKFTRGRWLTVGSSMRTLVASCLLGLRGIYKATVDDPKVSLFNLNGFSRLSESMLYFATVACVAPRAVEAVQVELLEDDRALVHFDALEAAALDELVWMDKLPSGAQQP